MQFWIKNMQVSKKLETTRTISVLLCDSFSNHCLANAIEPFRAANTIARTQLYSWSHWSLEGGTVTSSSGLPVETISWSDAAPRGDFLFIMPSYGFTDLASPRMCQVLRAASERYATIVGMDTGAWLLAKAGLLEDRKATIHWDEFTNFSETFPSVMAVEDRYVLADDIATCGGASTTFELTLELIKQHHSPMFALEVAALFMHGDRLDLHNPFHRLAPGALVQRATTLMRRNIEQPLTIPALSRQLRTDQKVLEQHFRAEFGKTPLAVYKSIRLREARRLVKLTSLTIAEIANRCGYQDASAMTRAYRTEYSTTPREHRSSIEIS
jgi:AraC family carnitine catabolism transcriptional activator